MITPIWPILLYFAIGAATLGIFHDSFGEFGKPWRGWYLCFWLLLGPVAFVIALIFTILEEKLTMKKEPEYQDVVKSKTSDISGIVIAKYTIEGKNFLDVRGSDDKIYYQTLAGNWETTIAYEA